jgi:hypothetical protein
MRQSGGDPDNISSMSANTRSVPASGEIGTAFVLAPVGSEGSSVRERADDVRDYIIEPAMGEVGLRVVRADTESTPGSVTASIVRAILVARLIVADLSGTNANVYYELGIAHSFGKAVVLLVDDLAALPFDVRDQRAIPIGVAPIRARDATTPAPA